MRPMSDPSPDAPPIDFAHLSRQTLGDGALQAELLDLFARQARTVMSAVTSKLAPDLSAPPAAADRPVADLLHTLCGSARAIGSWQVAEQAASLERELRAAPAACEGDYVNRVAALDRSVDDACRSIASLSADPLR